MNVEKLRQYIEYLEQFGADARYEINIEHTSLDKLKIIFDSMEEYSKLAKKELEKIKKEELKK